MLKQREVRFFGIVILIAVISVFVIAAINIGEKENSNKQRVQVYFLNSATTKLEPEEHKINISTNEDMIREMLSIIGKPPVAKNLSKVIPDSVEILDGSLVDVEGLLKLNFSSSYKDLALDEELFLRSALTWTMTELNCVSSIQILVEGEELLRADGKPFGALDRNNVVIDTVISPGISAEQRFVLYFSDEQAMGLLRESRTAEVVKLPDQLTEKYVLEQLIAGPKQPGHYATIPSDTKVRDVRTDAGTCYVNLSSEFISKHTGGSAQIRLTIYSIVNSLTELPAVQKVQFLIESEKSEDFKGEFDLSKPIERNEDIILK